MLLTLGTASVLTGNPYMTLAASGLPVASGTAAGSGVAYNSASGFAILAWSVDDWILSPQGRISATSPWNWQAGNYLRLSLTYEAA